MVMRRVLVLPEPVQIGIAVTHAPSERLPASSQSAHGCGTQQPSPVLACVRSCSKRSHWVHTPSNATIAHLSSVEGPTSLADSVAVSAQCTPETPFQTCSADKRGARGGLISRNRKAYSACSTAVVPNLNMSFLPAPAARCLSLPADRALHGCFASQHGQRALPLPPAPRAWPHDSYTPDYSAAQQPGLRSRCSSSRVAGPDVSMDDAQSVERATDAPAVLFIGSFDPDEVAAIEESLSDDTSEDSSQFLWMHRRCNAMPLRQLLHSFQPGSSVDVRCDAAVLVSAACTAKTRMFPDKTADVSTAGRRLTCPVWRPVLICWRHTS